MTNCDEVVNMVDNEKKCSWCIHHEYYLSESDYDMQYCKKHNNQRCEAHEDKMIPCEDFVEDK